jgi:hypothetical protein
LARLGAIKADAAIWRDGYRRKEHHRVFCVAFAAIHISEGLHFVYLLTGLKKGQRQSPTRRKRQG